MTSIAIATLTRQFREALEVYESGSGPKMIAVRRNLDDLTDQILDARILDGVDGDPVRVDISHVEWDLP